MVHVGLYIQKYKECPQNTSNSCIYECSKSCGSSHTTIIIGHNVYVTSYCERFSHTACNINGFLDSSWSYVKIYTFLTSFACQISNIKVHFEIRPLELYLQIRSPKLKSEHNPPTLSPLPLDKHPTCLCLEDIFFFF